MPNLKEIRNRTIELRYLADKEDAISLEAATSDMGGCIQADLARLEELRNEADTLRQQLREMKNKSKLDPEVLEIERKLNDALTRYYWLWQKCKENICGVKRQS